MIKRISYVLILMFAVACTPRTFMVQQMIPVLQESAQALYAESDLQLAESALASNLKLLEGLLQSDPENTDLLLLLAQGYAGYALAFAEDSDPQRAKMFYLRARDYALRVLNQDKKFRIAREQGLEQLQAVLNSYDTEQVPALFWTGFSWSGYINLALDEPRALLDLPQVEVLMRRVEELQADYYFGSVYLFWGSLYGMKPAMLGGDVQKAGRYFQKAIDLNQGNFLLAYLYAARFYAAKKLDEDLFDHYLNEIKNRPAGISENLTMLNQVAKQKARRLEAMREELF